MAFPNFYGKRYESASSFLDDLEMAFLVSGRDEEEVKQRAFSLVLRKEAKVWFQGLEQRKKGDWGTLHEAFMGRFGGGCSPEEIWQKLSSLQQTSPLSYLEYEAQFLKLWAEWENTLEQGERASNFLQKERFLDGLSSPLKEKVKEKFPRTFEEAMQLAQLKDRKLQFQAYLSRTNQPQPQVQNVAHEVPTQVPTTPEDPHLELLQRVTNQLDNLSINMVQGAQRQQHQPPNGCITCLAPCVTFGQLGEILDTGTRSCLLNAVFYMGAACVACPWVYSTQYRTKLRLKFGLPPSPCNDCVVHFFCEPCALCQESRELKARGIDPALECSAEVKVLHSATELLVKRATVMACIHSRDELNARPVTDRALARSLGIHRRNIILANARLHLEDDNTSFPVEACQRKIHRTACITEDIKDLVLGFWTTETQVSPNKKDICQKHIGRKAVLKHPVRLLDQNQVLGSSSILPKAR
ncbi:hypothetical protein L7F22_041754 [Adiantum nelumboides]|nr:hypothetical protein [Adiantum nelumboides]